MRLEDRRPAFAGLANLTEQQLQSLPTPCYLLDEAQLRRNGQIMLELQQRTGCRALLAQKAFSNFDVYPVLAPYLAGTEASGLYESRLGREQLPEKENHVFCAAYRADEFAELLQYADHIVFNSPGQLAQFGPAAKAAGKSVGLRVNPECSTQEGHAIYDPCAPGSRLGTTRAQWDAAVAAHPELPELLDGLHFHTLCEQDSDALETTAAAFEEGFGEFLPGLSWLNLGGGHHITRADYDRKRLVRIVKGLRERYGLEIYLEPGEAVVLKLDVEPWTLITDKHLDEACKKCGIDPASLKGKVLCLNTGMHRLFDDSKAYYHYSIGTGIDAGKWFVKHGVKCVAMDSQALDHPLHTAMGNNGMTRMNLLGATGKPFTEEYKELFGEEAYAEFDKFEYIRIHGQAAYDEKFGELEDLGVWGTWEPCHKEMLGHGIVGVENLGGDLDKIKPGKVFNFFCFPLRWYMGDGAMSRCVAFIDEDDVDASVPDRT